MKWPKQERPRTDDYLTSGPIRPEARKTSCFEVTARYRQEHDVSRALKAASTKHSRFDAEAAEVGVAGVMKALGRKALVRTPAPKAPLKITAVETQLAFVAA